MTERNMRVNGFQIIKIEREPITAPCQPDGEVVTIDYDTKDAMCKCNLVPNGFPVDGRNKVLHSSYSIQSIQ
jgi:hypothetical protein